MIIIVIVPMRAMKWASHRSLPSRVASSRLKGVYTLVDVGAYSPPAGDVDLQAICVVGCVAWPETNMVRGAPFGLPELAEDGHTSLHCNVDDGKVIRG